MKLGSVARNDGLWRTALVENGKLRLGMGNECPQWPRAAFYIGGSISGCSRGSRTCFLAEVCSPENSRIPSNFCDCSSFVF